VRGPADHLSPLTALDPPERHLAGIRRILEYLRAGDVYQVNLARRLIAPLPATTPPGLSLFTRLQTESPAPHALWLVAEDGACLIGNSPERFLRVLPGGQIETRPIKGTRPRAAGADPAAAALARDPKDNAEHLMIVDLERNDLGRVCLPGSITVEGFARIVSLATVHHLVSTVRGQLRPGLPLAELLRATFPGGSITGAPKIRAMEIIDELEPAARGPYCGATGWLGAAGDLDLAIAIRTALVRDDLVTLWVGGGIVADSVPEDELRETEVKARAFARLA
jgi:anthranilate/para-aminobenzoate synthase component I